MDLSMLGKGKGKKGEGNTDEKGKGKAKRLSTLQDTVFSVRPGDT